MEKKETRKEYLARRYRERVDNDPEYREKRRQASRDWYNRQTVEKLDERQVRRREWYRNLPPEKKEEYRRRERERYHKKKTKEHRNMKKLIVILAVALVAGAVLADGRKFDGAVSILGMEGADPAGITVSVTADAVDLDVECGYNSFSITMECVDVIDTAGKKLERWVATAKAHPEISTTRIVNEEQFPVRGMGRKAIGMKGNFMFFAIKGEEPHIVLVLDMPKDKGEEEPTRILVHIDQRQSADFAHALATVKQKRAVAISEEKRADQLFN